MSNRMKISSLQGMGRLAAGTLVVLAAVAAIAAGPGTAPTTAPAAAPAVDQHGPTIKDVYAKCFLVGTAGDLPGNYSDAEMALVREHFNVVTPENCMKPGPIHPAADKIGRASCRERV